MTDQPNTDTPAATDDSWLKDDVPFDRDKVLAGSRKSPARPTVGTVTPLRPLDRLGDDLDNAPIAAGSGNPPPPPPPPESLPPAEPGGKGSRDRPRGEIWAGCPVKPLGVNGGTYYYLDVHSQMRPVAKHDAQTIMTLFGNQMGKLCWQFPKWVKAGEDMVRKADHFDHQLATVAMIQACSDKGLFNPDGAVRGLGAWVDDDGQLIYHTGNALFVGDDQREPSAHMGKIYPAYPPIPHPALAPKSNPAEAMLDVFGTWNWERPDIDPTICLGMIGVQMFGGALNWRPTFWNTGSRSTGKSSFQTLLKHIHGPGGLIQSTDTTKSGITSQIGHSALPVAVDELEPGDDHSGKEKAIIDLARIASSGGMWFRGTADQRGVSGNVYSTMFFSSILIPGSMNTADISRLVILSLLELPKDAIAPSLKPETWRNRGAALKRTLMDRWSTWGQRLDLWREALAEVKITGRNGDNYATILAMADMAQRADLPNAEILTGWAAKLAGHIKAEIDDIGSDATAVLTHLLSQQFDPFRRGERHSVATWLKAAGWRHGAGRRLFGTQDGASALSIEDQQELDQAAKRANASLAAIGLRVVGTPLQPELFVSTAKMQGLLDLFAKSSWAGGAWSQSLKRVPGAHTPKGSRYLDGQQTKGTVVPFAAMPGLMALDGAEVAPPAPAQANNIDLEGSY